jgi:hypothetical protein
MTTTNANNRKPAPLYAPIQRAVCPVCHTTSYSPAGIHPQCAMRHADEAQKARLKAQPAEPPKRAEALHPYEKLCPRCQVVQHVRRRSCECGYEFPTTAR